MRLTRLKIQTLPGIEPGFTFEPPGAGVNIVTGPNAIGKSSLARALGYLLHGAHKEDPPALSLEAEFESGATTWRVLRNGSQVVWHLNGELASRPTLPGAGQTGLYRLSMEQLLTGDDYDRDFARELLKALRGDFDLDALRTELSARFAHNEKKNLHNAEQALRQAEVDYDGLERQEQELPRLSRDIEAAEAAQKRVARLQDGLKLYDAICARKSCAGELKIYPHGMHELQGDEQQRLAELEDKSRSLDEELREQQRRLQEAETSLEQTGLQQSAPDPERLEAIDSCLQQLGQKIERHRHARKDLAEADAALKEARVPFKGAGKPPCLDAQSLEQAEAIAAPLIKAQNRRDKLQLRYDQAGTAPDEAEINRLNKANGALRHWLSATEVEAIPQATRLEQGLRRTLWIILILTASCAVILPGVLAILAGLLAVGLLCTAVWDWFFVLGKRRQRAGSATQQAQQEFNRTGLAGPPDWTVAAVQEYLDTQVEQPYNELLLRKERAAQAADIRPELQGVEAEIAELQARKQAVAAELGFDPELPSISPDLFIQHCRQLAGAESRYHEAKAGVGGVEQDIARNAALARDFLVQWRRTDAPLPGEFEDEHDINLLQASFQDVKRRASKAEKTRDNIERAKQDIRRIKGDIDDNQAAIKQIFTKRGLEPGDRVELDRRLGLLKEWQEKCQTLENEKAMENGIRSELGTSPEIIRDADEGNEAKLQNDLAMALEQAGKYTELVQEQARITTRLNDAGKDRKLSDAYAGVNAAKAILEDKRDHALLHEGTEILLNDVEQAFHTENEPQTLRRARTLFREITAHAFDLELNQDDRFIAQDLKQEAPRALSELSSGTRMQLLLALRLAWVETQEQGRETLPLFLDEALTTSDEDRFSVMANSLERLAATENRQIFYLSARRHECALWRQATGNEPPVIDLAMARFPRQEHSPQDYDITLPPAVPAPEDRDPEDYASVLGVPRFNPSLEPGAVHLFYLLRDDLALLYQLMDNWHITSLGQLKALLDSDAGSKAITETRLRDRLLQRCDAVRTWMELWRRGRGRPVNRGVLERSKAVSGVYIKRVTELVENLGGNGKALVKALYDGKVSRFHTSKIEELERWLADEGYTDQEEVLTQEECRRQTLQQAMSGADAEIEDVNQVITWLESASL